MTRDEVIRTIEQFIDGTTGDWDWDDFVIVADADPILERARRRCVHVTELFPPEGPHQWCGPKGLDELRQVVHELRQLPRTGQD